MHWWETIAPTAFPVNVAKLPLIHIAYGSIKLIVHSNVLLDGDDALAINPPKLARVRVIAANAATNQKLSSFDEDVKWERDEIGKLQQHQRRII